MQYAITFLEGIVTFISPCLLPLLPVYVAFFAGGEQERSRGAVLGQALAFVAGFTAVFALLGALAAVLGTLLIQSRWILDIVCGVIIVLFGLGCLGLFELPTFSRLQGLKAKAGASRGILAAFVFGAAFSIGWTPCVGAFLGSALSLAASTAHVGEGVALLVCFSLGLGVPFVISALLIRELEGAFAFIKRHYRVINIVSGMLLIVLGILLATGQLGTWMALLNA